VVLRPQRIGVLPGLTDADVLQSAQLLPGVNSPDETAAGLQIRGGTPDQNLVLWDGIPVYHSGHYFGMISAFNPHAVGQYEVFRNGFGAEHGGRVAGLVNIASDNALKDRVEAGGGANLLFGDAYAKVPVGNSGARFMVAGRRSFTDLFNSLPYERLNERVFQHTRVVEEQQLAADQLVELLDEFQFTDLNASLTLPTAKGTLSLSGLYVQNRLDHAVFEGDFGLALEDRLDLDNWGMSARWDAGTPGKQQGLPLSVVAAHSEYDYKYDFFMSELSGLVPLESSIKENLVRHSTLKATLSPTVGNNNRLKLGYQLDRQQVVFRVEYVEVGEDDLVESSDTTTYRHGLFGEYTLQLGPVTVQPGLRYQYNSLNQTHYLEPRGFVHWRLSDALRLRATGGLYHQFISQLLELDFNELGVNNQVWSLSNDDNVPVVSSDHWSVGAIWRKHGWLVDVEGYIKRQRDITSLTTSFSAIQDNPYSEGSATMTGIDVLLKKQWRHVRAWVSYTLSRFRYDFEEISAEAFAAPHDQRHNLAAAVIVDRGPWSFSLGWRLGSGLPYTALNGLTEIEDDVEEETVWRPDWGTQNNERLRTYHRLDASVLYHL
ncbi:MAG: TonB-dependent receptor plug domain-containing protein, partial [Bacteroidota bacterium]